MLINDTGGINKTFIQGFFSLPKIEYVESTFKVDTVI